MPSQVVNANPSDFQVYPQPSHRASLPLCQYVLYLATRVSPGWVYLCGYLITQNNFPHWELESVPILTRSSKDVIEKCYHYAKLPELTELIRCQQCCESCCRNITSSVMVTFSASFLTPSQLLSLRGWQDEQSICWIICRHVCSTVGCNVQELNSCLRWTCYREHCSSLALCWKLCYSFSTVRKHLHL